MTLPDNDDYGYIAENEPGPTPTEMWKENHTPKWDVDRDFLWLVGKRIVDLEQHEGELSLTFEDGTGGRIYARGRIADDSFLYLDITSSATTTSASSKRTEVSPFGDSQEPG